MRKIYHMYSYFILNIVTYLLIPACTCMLAASDGLTGSNLSLISGRENYRLFFILWIVTIIAYMKVTIEHIITGNRLKYTGNRLILLLSCILLVLSAVMPYTPEIYPVKARLHIIFAFSGTVAFLFLILRITLELSLCGRPGGKRYFLWALAISLLSLVMFISFGMVTSLLEIFITVSCCILANKLLYPTIM